MPTDRPATPAPGGGAAGPETAFADTSLFLRLFTNDLPEQADRVEALLERAERGELALVTTVMVVAEIASALERFYGLTKADVRDRVLALLNTPGLWVESEDLVLQGAVWYAEKNVDFIDAYNAAWLRERGVKPAYTFDQKHFGRFDHLDARLPGEVDGETWS